MITLGCTESKSSIYNTEKINIISLTGPLDKKLYLFTSLDGCSTCLSHTTKFIEEHINNKNMIFVVSGKSKIQLHANFKKSTIVSPNFINDTTLISLKKGLVDISFPKVYLCKDEEIVEAFEVSSMNADRLFPYAANFVNIP